HRFSDWLRGLSCARWRKVLGLHRVGGGGLLSDSDLARPAGVYHFAPGHSDVGSRVSAPLGPASPDRPLDHADLALRFGYRRDRLFVSLPLVSARVVMQART